MRVTVQDGVAVELKGDAEHPFTRGFLCQKMARYLDRVYSPDRLMFPMKRVGAKGEGRFERISWDEALETIATRFAAIAASPDGPQAILPYSYYGTMGKLQASSLDRRFFHRLGASKLDRTICASAGSLGYEYTVGRGRHGRRPAGGAAVQVHRQLGLEHGQHQQPSLEPDGRGPQDRTERRSSPSTPTAARPPAGPTGTSPRARAPMPPWPWA